VVTQATMQLALARQTRLQRGSSVWRSVLAIYRRAAIEAKYDRDVWYAISDFEAFMKARPRGKRARRRA
jgi:hypothetical protein